MIIRADISDHFPIPYSFKLRSSTSTENHQKNRYLHKRIIHESSNRKHYSNAHYAKTSWDGVKDLDDPNKSYEKFIETIAKIYIMTVSQKLNSKSNLTTRLIHGLKKSLQRLRNANKNHMKNS